MIERLRSQHGFTLLEVLIALAILASALTVLIGTTATSNQQAIYANKLTRVSQLARSKMTDIEYEMMDEGFPDTVQRLDGDFGEEGYDHISWEAEVFPVEIPPEVKEELIAQVNAQLFGGQDTQGALKGNAAFSAMLPMLVAQVPEMINQIGKKIRRVKLVVTYDFHGSEETMTVTQYIVDRDQAGFDLFGTGESDSGSEGGEE
ncbi:prepilin-type N-terminal cleavage/methylation domain-containing protein [Persicimonas caeni]|nr:prepilin-type N-terminal cleavage/methylation domain-containing protein [Persicimonas caeni]